MIRQPRGPYRQETWLGRDLAAAALLIAAAVFYYLLPVAALSLPCLALLAYLIWQRSDLAVTLIPLAMPLYMLPKHLQVVRSLDFSLGETVLLLTAAVVVIQQAGAARGRVGRAELLRLFFPESPFAPLALVFLVAAAIATLTAHYHGYALRYFRWIAVEPILYYWLITQRVRDLTGASRLALVAACAGIVIAALGIAQILFRPHDMAVASFVPGQPHLSLVRAVYGNENNLALLLDRALPFAAALLLFPGWMAYAFREPARGAANPSMTRALQLALLLGSCMMLYVLYRTQSRGGELAVAVCAVAGLAYVLRKRPVVIGAVALAAIAVLLVGRNRIWDRIAHGHGLTTDARISVWQSALRMVRDHPLFGVGPDNFLYYYSNDDRCAKGHIAAYYYRQKNGSGVPVNFEPCLSHPHNLFLDFWLSTGLAGFVVAMALLALFTVLTLKALRLADPAWRGPLAGSLLAMLAFAVHGQVDNSYFLPDLAVYFWLSVGITSTWYAAGGPEG